MEDRGCLVVVQAAARSRAPSARGSGDAALALEPRHLGRRVEVDLSPEQLDRDPDEGPEYSLLPHSSRSAAAAAGGGAVGDGAPLPLRRPPAGRRASPRGRPTPRNSSLAVPAGPPRVPRAVHPAERLARQRRLEHQVAEDHADRGGHRRAADSRRRSGRRTPPRRGTSHAVARRTSPPRPPRAAARRRRSASFTHVPWPQPRCGEPASGAAAHRRAAAAGLDVVAGANGARRPRPRRSRRVSAASAGPPHARAYRAAALARLKRLFGVAVGRCVGWQQRGASSPVRVCSATFSRESAAAGAGER